MAVPAYSSDLDSGVIYTDGGTWTTLSGRVTDPDTDDYIQGSSCWSHDPFSSAIEGGVVNSSQTITAGSAVFVWTKADIAPALATKSSGGVQVLIGNSSTTLDCFYVAGSDTLTYGGWKNFPVDPTKSPSTTVGGGGTGTTSYFGVRWNIPSTGPGKGYPFKIDAIRWGSKIEITAGEVANPASWTTTAAYDSVSTRQWGMVQPTDTGAAIQGDIYWGTASASVYSRDSNKTVVINDTEWTDTDFTQIIFAHASNDVVWDNVGLIALGTNNRGIIDVTANGTIEWTNSVFQGIDVTNLDTNSTFDGSKWLSTNEVDGSGASLLDAKILTPTVATDSYGLLWNSATNPNGKLDGMEFSMGSNSHHAITFGTSVTGDITLTNCDFSGFGSTADANDSTVKFLATSGSLTLNLVGCTVDGADATTSNFSVHDSAGVTVTVSISVPVTVTVKDTGGNLLTGIQTAVYLTSDRTEVMNEATVTGVASTSFGGTTPAECEVRCRSSSTGTRYKNF
jgi:hypothetical protein